MNNIKIYLILLLSLIIYLSSCTASPKFTYTVKNVDIQKFMGKWYVIEARPTFLEENAYNPIESYEWNAKEQRIDIDYSYTKGSLTGPLKHIYQKAWIYNKETNAHWEVSPLWPFKFDYLVIALDSNYQWTVIGVPNEKYLWIMARKPTISKIMLEEIKTEIKKLGYPLNEMKIMEHNQIDSEKSNR